MESDESSLGSVLEDWKSETGDESLLMGDDSSLVTVLRIVSFLHVFLTVIFV